MLHLTRPGCGGYSLHRPFVTLRMKHRAHVVNCFQTPKNSTQSKMNGGRNVTNDIADQAKIWVVWSSPWPSLDLRLIYIRETANEKSGRSRARSVSCQTISHPSFITATEEGRRAKDKGRLGLFGDAEQQNCLRPTNSNRSPAVNQRHRPRIDAVSIRQRSPSCSDLQTKPPF